jgi:hypothetical protein
MQLNCSTNARLFLPIIHITSPLVLYAFLCLGVLPPSTLILLSLVLELMQLRLIPCSCHCSCDALHIAEAVNKQAESLDYERETSPYPQTLRGITANGAIDVFCVLYESTQYHDAPRHWPSLLGNQLVRHDFGRDAVIPSLTAPNLG